MKVVGGEAAILHADLDAFYASVEQRDDPSLRGRPVLVGMGVVLACSYEAKAFGVRTAMGGRQARELCPDAVIVPPRMEAYSAASRDVFAIFRDTTPLVEGLSIDEAFLEVGGLRRIAGTPEQIAVRLRQRVKTEVGLAISVGVARTKFLAKVASAVSKPDGLLVVEPEREEAFLLPLPVERLWGVGAVTAEKLHRLGIHTVGELAELEAAAAERLLGKAAGTHLHALARLRDPRPVDTTRRRGSIGSQRALGSRPRSPEELENLEATDPPRSAAGMRSIKVATANAFRKMGPIRATRGLLALNQRGGIDCQSCAWPDPDAKRTVAEFCESGAKALADIKKRAASVAP